MERSAFHKLFKSGAAPAVFPVIHVESFEQSKRNVIVALRQGVQGVFLINHDFLPAVLLPIIKQIRAEFPYLWLGVNFLGVTGTVHMTDGYCSLVLDNEELCGWEPCRFSFSNEYSIILSVV